MRNFLASFLGKLHDRKGVSAAEYAILAVGIVIVVGGAVLAFQPFINNAFTNIGTQISTQQSSITAR